jgi:ribosomal protein L1
MPNPKTGTIVDDPQKMKDKFGADNRIELKIEKKAPLIHTVAGKLSMKDEQLENNVEAILVAVGKKNIKKAYLTTTMSPSVRLEV